MVKSIKKVGVIGAGLMGSSLAAQFANVGMEAILLDIVPPGGLSDEDRAKGLTEEDPQFRNRFAANGLKTALKAKPAAFYVPEAKELISIGPPRKLLSDTPYAMPLHTSNSSSAPTV